MFGAQDWYRIPNKNIPSQRVYEDEQYEPLDVLVGGLWNDASQLNEVSGQTELFINLPGDATAVQIDRTYVAAEEAYSISGTTAVASPLKPGLRLSSGSSAMSVGSNISWEGARARTTECIGQAKGQDLRGGDLSNVFEREPRDSRAKLLLSLLLAPSSEAASQNDKSRSIPKYKIRAPQPLQLDMIDQGRIALLEGVARLEVVGDGEEDDSPVTAKWRCDDKYVVGHGRVKEPNQCDNSRYTGTRPSSVSSSDSSWYPPSPSIRSIPLPGESEDESSEGGSGNRAMSPGAHSYTSNVTRIDYPEEGWAQVTTLTPLKAFEFPRLYSLADIE